MFPSGVGEGKLLRLRALRLDALRVGESACLKWEAGVIILSHILFHTFPVAFHASRRAANAGV